jgi:hypothetical protein
VFKSTDGGVNWTLTSAGLTDLRTRALAVDPVTPSTIYAGTRTLGVFKSVNSGANWAPTGLNNVFVTSIVIDPATPQTLYAATAGDGIYKSINGGTSWTPVNSGLLSLTVRTLAIHPSVTSTIYAGTASGLYKTVNGGGVWTASHSGLFDPDINAIVIDPRNPSFLLVATNSIGVFRSTNAGAFWLTSNSGLSQSGSIASALTLDPVSGAFYAAVGDGNGGQLFRSANGVTWTPAGLSTARIMAIAVDPTNSSAVHAATVGGTDAFVTKWNSSGNLVWSTYLGGYRDDAGQGIAVDSNANVYITGHTSSANFPLAAATQSFFGGGVEQVTDAFITELNPAGGSAPFSSYLGGTSNDFGRAVALDAEGNAYVVGVTGSGDFGNVAPLNSRPGLLDAFVARIVADTSVTPYAVPSRGGVSITSLGGAGATAVGYARIRASGSGSTPSGMAIFGFRQGGVLVSEAAVPASALISAGRIYAEIGGQVNTGIAIANPNDQAVTVTFYFTSNGQTCAGGSVAINANGQIAKFLSESPFNCSALTGTFTFSSTAPVSVIALRGLTNERFEFLITTLPVSDLALPPSTAPALFPHFADGGGWTTQIVLVNPTEEAMNGSVGFFSPGAGATAGQPAPVTIDGQTSAEFAYSIPPRGSRALRTAGLGTAIQTGSVRLTPSGTSKTPSGLGIFNYRNVSEAGVPGSPAGSAFRMFVESSGAFNASASGSMQTGVAIANASSTPATVNFELTTLTGSATGLTGSIVVPANGQVAMFLGQIPGFATLPNPFQGVLRVSTGTGGISIVGLRGRYNERRDFLITTTPPNNESAQGPPEVFFPHFADLGGYTTQFILYNGSTDQISTGSLRFFSQAGEALNLPVR